MNGGSFTNNEANNGAGVVVAGDAPTFNNVQFDANTVGTAGSVISIIGGEPTFSMANISAIGRDVSSSICVDVSQCRQASCIQPSATTCLSGSVNLIPVAQSIYQTCKFGTNAVVF